MADAGRILIIPKGDYDANSTYEKLDLVRHKGTSWIAKKDTTGIEPSEENAEYWQSMFGISIVDNLTTEESGQALDARQGKILDERITANTAQGKELDDKITAINNNFKKNALSVEISNITSYTESDRYTVKNDGYVYVGNGSGASGRVYINNAICIGGSTGYWAMPVRKGMQLHCSGSPTFASVYILT